MKPVDRSLEITVVGLGQGGGNIAAEFHRRGHRALALNTAHTDLAGLDAGGVYPEMPADRRVYIGLEGYDGAGADPSYGAACVDESAELIREEVAGEAAEADLILVAAGLGGGTGSAVNALLDVLQPLDRPLLGLFTLPTEAESALAKVNCVRAINELVDAPLAAWVFVDNARMTALHKSLSVVQYFARVNEALAAPLDELNRLNDREDLTVIRAFDGEDYRKLLLAGGVLNYGTVQIPNITEDEVAGAFLDALEASELMPAGFDPSSVSNMGFVLEAPAKVLDATPISVFEAIDARLKRETDGAAIYHGIYRKDGPGVTLRFLAATRSLPHRIRELLGAARQEGLALQEKLQSQLPTLDLGEIEGLDLFRPEAKNRASERPRRAPRRANLDDVRLDEIRGKRRAPEPPKTPPRPTATRPEKPVLRRPPPKPARRAPSRGRSGGKDPTSDVPFVDPEDEAADALLAQVGESSLVDRRLPEAETSEIDLADEMVRAKPREARPEVYDQLVADYLHAAETAAKDEIARRLEDDSLDEDTSVRYFAVDAMAKLGRDAFANALLAATEDENDAVRARALAALESE